MKQNRIPRIAKNNKSKKSKIHIGYPRLIKNDKFQKSIQLKEEKGWKEV